MGVDNDLVKKLFFGGALDPHGFRHNFSSTASFFDFFAQISCI